LFFVPSNKRAIKNSFKKTQMKKTILLFISVCSAMLLSAQVIPPYYEGFESGTSSWTSNSLGGTPWQIKTPNVPMLILEIG